MIAKPDAGRYQARMSQPAPSVMTSDLGTFEVRRWPISAADPLQGWDGADLHLLKHLAEVPLPEGPVLILNDTWGALAVALAAHRPILVTDALLSLRAIEHNGLANRVPHAEVVDCHAPWGPQPAAVLIKLPKTHALLEWQIARLRRLVGPRTRIIAAGLTRHVHRSTLAILGRLGSTVTSKAWRKARLAFVTVDSTLDGAGDALADLPAPKVWCLPGTDAEVVHHANVFSRDRLDIGTRFMLEHAPTCPDAELIVDLGCGGGALALDAARKHPAAQLIGIDQSFMAVRSAVETMARNGFEERFVGRVADGLEDQLPGSVDLILCNPPFHMEHAVSRQVASRMFRQAQRALRPSGALWIVANRHLGYRKWLRQGFGAVRRVAGNAKFDIIEAREPKPSRAPI